MNETIPPAMTPGEWGSGRAELEPMKDITLSFGDGGILLERGHEHGIEVRGDEALVAVIAAAMSQLSEGHPAKVTPMVVAAIRNAAINSRAGVIAEVEAERAAARRAAEILESYLHPHIPIDVRNGLFQQPAIDPTSPPGRVLRFPDPPKGA